MRVRAFVGIGSNVGDRQAHCAEAQAHLGRLPETDVLRVSPLVETQPAEGAAGGPFLNVNSNTRDTAGTGNDVQRVFTWPWGGHNNAQGFSFGSSVTDGDLTNDDASVRFSPMWLT